MSETDIQNFTHEKYLEYLNQKMKDVNNNQHSPQKPKQQNYLQDDIKDMYQNDDGDLKFLIEYHDNMQNGLQMLPENVPIDFAESGIIMSVERPFSYIQQQESQNYLPTYSGDRKPSQYSQKLNKHYKKLSGSSSDANFTKNYLKKSKQKSSQDNPIFQRSFDSVIQNRSSKQGDEIVDQKYLITQFFQLSDSVMEIETQVESREQSIQLALTEGKGDIPYNFKLSKLQVEQNRCSYVLGQLINLEISKIHSPYFERARLKIQTLYNLIVKLQKIEQFYAEIFDIYDYLIINISYLQQSMIQEVSQKLDTFLQEQKPIFLTKKEIDDSLYASSNRKMKSLSERFKAEMLQLLKDIEYLEETELEINDFFINQKEIHKLFSFQNYIVKLNQFSDHIKQKINITGNEGLLSITRILYNKIIDSVQAVNFRYFAEYDNSEIEHSLIFAEEVYKQKNQLKEYIKNDQVLNSQQMLNLSYYYDQVVQERRKTQNDLLRQVYRKFLKARKNYLKKVGLYVRDQ